jgi:hypothetical protein
VPLIEGFLGGGGAALLILALVCVEATALALRHRRGMGPPLLRWLSPMLAGAALVAALWLEQSGAPPVLLGPPLALAGLAHLLGAKERWGLRQANRTSVN